MKPDIQEEFTRCTKLNWRLLQAILTAADDAEFVILMETNKPPMLEKQPEQGIIIRSNIADKFYTAAVTQDGLLSLMRDDRVKREDPRFYVNLNHRF